MEFNKIEKEVNSTLPPSQQSEPGKPFGQQFDPTQSEIIKDKPARVLSEEKKASQKKMLFSLLIALIVIGGAWGGWWYYDNWLSNSIQTPVVSNNTDNTVQEENNLPAEDQSNPIISDESPVLPEDTIDSDQDGLSDKDEVLYNTDPADSDSDDDTYLDGQEVANGYNPLGSGLLNPITTPPTENNSSNTTEFNLATAQNTADAMAYAINNNDTDLLVRIISPNNPSYAEIIADPASFLALYQYAFEFKKVKIEVVTETPEEYPDTITIATKVYTDDQLYQEGSTRLEKIDNEWKILQ